MRVMDSLRRCLRWGKSKISERLSPPEDMVYAAQTVHLNEGLASDGYPIPPRALWHSGASSFDEFMSAGAEHYNTMRLLLKENGFPYLSHHRILDFGCSSGRTVRFWKDEAWAEVWGCEVDNARVRWCQANLSDQFRFVQTTTTPHLPFEDRYFSLVYAGSVFTHIRDVPDCWLLELRRIVEPGGLLYITLHDEHTWSSVWTGEAAALHYLTKTRSLSSKRDLSFDFLAFGVGDECQVFYRSEYFVRMARMWFEILDVRPRARGYQTAVILRRPVE